MGLMSRKPHWDSILTAKTPAMFGNQGEHLWNTLKMYVEENKKFKCNIKLFNKLNLSFLFFFFLLFFIQVSMDGIMSPLSFDENGSPVYAEYDIVNFARTGFIQVTKKTIFYLFSF